MELFDEMEESEIEKLYDMASEGNFREWNDSTNRYDMMLENMPQIEWLK